MKRTAEVSRDRFPNKRPTITDECDCYDIQKPLISFGRQGSTFDSLFNPIGLAVHPSNGLIFIGEYTYLSTLTLINIYSCEGEYITSFGKDYLTSIGEITVDEFSIYVSDPFLFVLIQFTDFHIKTEKIPFPTNEFPKGIVSHIDGFLYWVDSRNTSVQVYDPDFCLVRTVCLTTHAIPIRLSFLSDIMVVFCINPTVILYYSMEGKELRVLANFDKFLSNCEHFCVDTRTNNTYMSDRHKNHIMVFNIEGNLIRVIVPARSDLCVTPTFLAISPHDHLVVVTPFGSTTIQLYRIDT